MSYAKDLDEYDDIELAVELLRRNASRAVGVCPYCRRAYATQESCKCVSQHMAHPRVTVTQMEAATAGPRASWPVSALQLMNFLRQLFQLREGTELAKLLLELPLQVAQQRVVSQIRSVRQGLHPLAVLAREATTAAIAGDTDTRKYMLRQLALHAIRAATEPTMVLRKQTPAEARQQIMPVLVPRPTDGLSTEGVVLTIPAADPLVELPDDEGLRSAPVVEAEELALCEQPRGARLLALILESEGMPAENDPRIEALLPVPVLDALCQRAQEFCADYASGAIGIARWRVRQMMTVLATVGGTEQLVPQAAQAAQQVTFALPPGADRPEADMMLLSWPSHMSDGAARELLQATLAAVLNALDGMLLSEAVANTKANLSTALQLLDSRVREIDVLLHAKSPSLEGLRAQFVDLCARSIWTWLTFDMVMPEGQKTALPQATVKAALSEARSKLIAAEVALTEALPRITHVLTRNTVFWAARLVAGLPDAERGVAPLLTLPELWRHHRDIEDQVERVLDNVLEPLLASANTEPDLVHQRTAFRMALGANNGEDLANFGTYNVRLANHKDRLCQLKKTQAPS